LKSNTIVGILEGIAKDGPTYDVTWAIMPRRL